MPFVVSNSLVPEFVSKFARSEHGSEGASLINQCSRSPCCQKLEECRVSRRGRAYRQRYHRLNRPRR
jgi:hypothetical protein